MIRTPRLLSRLGPLAVLLLGLLVLVPQEAQAQRWLQTTQVIAPIENEGPARALLDTLVNYLEREDSLMVRRAPDQPTKYSAGELSNVLIDAEALDISSANNVFIDYRFAVDRDGFEENITALYFIFRPAGTGEEDIPIMYLNVKKEEWVQNVLKHKGTTLVTNEAALKPFLDQLAFARIVREKDAQIVEIGDRKVREGFDAKKRQLVDKITRLTYSSR